MIKIVRDLFDEFMERAEVFGPIQGEALETIKRNVEEVRHLALTEGAAIELVRTAGLLRRSLQVPVTSGEEEMHREMLKSLNEITIIATAFKQYFSVNR